MKNVLLPALLATGAFFFATSKKAPAKKKDEPKTDPPKTENPKTEEPSDDPLPATAELAAAADVRTQEEYDAFVAEAGNPGPTERMAIIHIENEDAFIPDVNRGYLPLDQDISNKLRKKAREEGFGSVIFAFLDGDIGIPEPSGLPNMTTYSRNDEGGVDTVDFGESVGVPGFGRMPTLEEYFQALEDA